MDADMPPDVDEIVGGMKETVDVKPSGVAAGGEAVGRIFLSYRRTDAPHAAGRLFEHFTSRFGVDKVFMDVNSIDAGLDFVDIIEAAVDACNVLLAVIGPHWLDAVDERGRRRLDDPDDFVSLEITTALRRGIRVIPVLIDGTPLPQQDELPRHLAALSRRQSVGLNHATFGAGITSLMTAVEQAIRTPARTAVEVPQGPTYEESHRPTSSASKPTAAQATAPSGIEEKIDQALRARAAQQPLVDQLSAAWKELSRGLSDLITTAEDVGQPRSTTPTRPEAHTRASIAAVLTGDGDSPLTRHLSDRTRNVERLIAAVRARVRRDTVNIGVIGSTKSGKSTLLRTITGLPEGVIPSTKFSPTTAAAVYIYQSPDRASAFLTLHTWESFRDTYLAPLHQSANLGPPPRQPDDFRTHRYPTPGSAIAGLIYDDFLRKLDQAQSSFDSYEHLLISPARTLEVEFATIRPYVAYPDAADRDSVNIRPYHAVRDVCIRQRFIDVAAAIGLIDLPGAGEAGLDVDTQFVQRVKNEIDFLLMIKRGGTVSSAYLAEDSYALLLADSARGGAALEDFVAVVVNRDERHDAAGEYFAETFAAMRAAMRNRRITVLATDVTERKDVSDNLLRPVSDQLATTLARMDRANIDSVLLEAGQTAGEIARFAGSLAAHAERQLRALPNQEFELRRLSRDLIRNVGRSLYALLTRYDNLVVTRGTAEPLARGINAATQAAYAWVDDGLGMGSPEAWLAAIKGSWSVGPLHTTQEEYFRARTAIMSFFADVDFSLEESVHELWSQTASVLRSHLSAELVPATQTGQEALEYLRDRVAQPTTPMVREALDQLLRLKAAFGSMVLRVTGPIVRTMSPLEPQTNVLPAIVGGNPLSTPANVMPSAPPGVQALYVELTSSARTTIAQLDRRLNEEAYTAVGVLAGAINTFFDGMIRANDIEWEYELICGPNRREIWPAEFRGGIPGLAAELSDLQKQAQVLIAASRSTANG